MFSYFYYTPVMDKNGQYERVFVYTWFTNSSGKKLRQVESFYCHVSWYFTNLQAHKPSPKNEPSDLTFLYTGRV